MTVSISNSTLGGTGSNSFSLRDGVEAVGAAANLNALSAIVEDFYQAIDNVYSTGTTISFNGAFTGLGPNEGELIEGNTWTVAGAETGYSLPPANCIVVGWRGATGGRNGRGRSFLGPVADGTAESNGTIHPTYLTMVRTAASSLVSASLADLNGGIGIWSQLEGVHRDVATTATRDKFAVLRSRRD